MRTFFFFKMRETKDIAHCLNAVLLTTFRQKTVQIKEVFIRGHIQVSFPHCYLLCILRENTRLIQIEAVRAGRRTSLSIGAQGKRCAACKQPYLPLLLGSLGPRLCPDVRHSYSPNRLFRPQGVFLCSSRTFRSCTPAGGDSVVGERVVRIGALSTSTPFSLS